MKYFFKLLAVGISLILLAAVTSCSPQRRFTRLVTKHPELVQTDTIIRIDTLKVPVPKVEKDTAFLEKYLRDTVVIEKERLKLKLWKVYDTIKVEAECGADTIEVIREVEIPIHYYEKEEGFWNKLFTSIKYIMWILIIAVAVATVYKFIKSTK